MPSTRAGDLFVSDTYNERMEKFTLVGGVYKFSLAWGMRGENPNTFNYPRLMWFDPENGDIIVANTDSNEIVAWTTAGHEGLWAGTGLADPYGVACGANGNVYAANSNGQNVVVFNSSGAKIATIGSGTRVRARDLGRHRRLDLDRRRGDWRRVSLLRSGRATLQFTVSATGGAFGIAGDAGFLYIALSSSNNSVAQYTRSGTLVSTFGGAGSTLGPSRTPQGLTFGPNGNLFVVEENTDRVSEWVVP